MSYVESKPIEWIERFVSGLWTDQIFIAWFFFKKLCHGKNFLKNYL